MSRHPRLVLALALLVALQARVAPAQGVVRAVWDMNPSTENVLHYYVQLDEGDPQYIYTAGPQCSVGSNSCYADFPITDNLLHTVSNWAANQWGYGPASRISFSLGIPSAPANLRMTVPDSRSGTSFRTVTPPPGSLQAPTGLREVPPPPPAPPPGTPPLEPQPPMPQRRLPPTPMVPPASPPGGAPPSAPTVR
jgi:hypothetical protein